MEEKEVKQVHWFNRTYLPSCNHSILFRSLHRNSLGPLEITNSVHACISCARNSLSMETIDVSSFIQFVVIIKCCDVNFHMLYQRHVPIKSNCLLLAGRR